MRRILIFGVFLTLSIGVERANANGFNLLGAGARSQAVAGAAASSVSDFTAVYHNPASLAFGRPSFGFGVHGTFDRTSILLAPRPTGYDPPGYETRPNERQDTLEGGGSASVLLGASFSPWPERLAFGLVALVPMDGMANIATHYSDETEQHFSNRLHFTRFGHAMQREAIGFAVAYRAQSWLSMGLGMMLLPQVETVNTVYTPNATELETVELTMTTRPRLNKAVLVGLRVQPLDVLTIGATFQDELSLTVQGGNKIQVRNTNDDQPFSQPLNFEQQYQPPRATLSVTGGGEARPQVTAEATWFGWSRFRNHQRERVDFNDIIEYRLGTELPFSDDAAFRFGVAWKPSPIPAQTGRTNYVDNHRWAVTSGVGQPFRLWGEDFRADVYFAFQYLLTETVNKPNGAGEDSPSCTVDPSELCDEYDDPGDGFTDAVRARASGLQTGNPGFPGYQHGGYLVNAGVDLQWLF